MINPITPPNQHLKIFNNPFTNHSIIQVDASFNLDENYHEGESCLCYLM